MPFRVFERYPGKNGKKGSAKSYIDPVSGEILSATKYRDYKAETEGFTGFRQKQTAHKKQITISKTGFIQHHYYLGIPKNLAQVISDILRGYEYIDSFAIGAIYMVEEAGSDPDEMTAQSNLYPCLPMYIRGALDELKLSLMLYMIAKLKAYFITIYPPKGAF